MNRIFPYPTVAGDIELEVRDVQMDGIPLNYSLISKKESVIALHQVEKKGWDQARLGVRVRLPEEEISNGPWSDCICAAVISERQTNTRVVTPLSRQGDGHWAGTVELYRDRHRGQVLVEAVLIGTVEDVPGRVICRSDPWIIDLKARTPTKERSIRTVWEDFSENPRFLPYKNEAWLVEVAGDEPTVFLNKSFEGLSLLLGERPGADKSAKEVIASEIAADTWSALFNAALYAAGEDEGQPVWPGGWADAVLKKMLPDIFPDWSPNDALTEVVRRRTEGEGGGELQTRIQLSAAKQARKSKALLGFARGVNRAAAKEGA